MQTPYAFRRLVLGGMLVGMAAASATVHAAAVVASGTIIDIDATSKTGTSITLQPGTYQLSWAGTAGGGLYDAWAYKNAKSGNFREAFSLTVGGVTTTYDGNDGNAAFNNYLNAASAIAYFTGNAANDSFQTYAGFTDKGTAMGLVQGPIVFTVTEAGTYTFSVPDYQFTDNSGGVSLRLDVVTNTSNAVPTPGSGLLSITALGALAGLYTWQRRRKRAAATPADTDPA